MSLPEANAPQMKSIEQLQTDAPGVVTYLTTQAQRLLALFHGDAGREQKLTALFQRLQKTGTGLSADDMSGLNILTNGNGEKARLHFVTSKLVAAFKQETGNTSNVTNQE